MKKEVALSLVFRGFPVASFSGFWCWCATTDEGGEQNHSLTFWGGLNPLPDQLWCKYRTASIRTNYSKKIFWTSWAVLGIMGGEKRSTVLLTLSLHLLKSYLVCSVKGGLMQTHNTDYIISIKRFEESFCVSNVLVKLAYIFFACTRAFEINL